MTAYLLLLYARLLCGNGPPFIWSLESVTWAGCRLPPIFLQYTHLKELYVCSSKSKHCTIMVYANIRSDRHWMIRHYGRQITACVFDFISKHLIRDWNFFICVLNQEIAKRRRHKYKYVKKINIYGKHEYLWKARILLKRHKLFLRRKTRKNLGQNMQCVN